eukprot:1159268-Pleurochrysis_carterae.AAC.3
MKVGRGSAIELSVKFATVPEGNNRGDHCCTRKPNFARVCSRIMVSATKRSCKRLLEQTRATGRWVEATARFSMEASLCSNLTATRKEAFEATASNRRWPQRTFILCSASGG